MTSERKIVHSMKEDATFRKFLTSNNSHRLIGLPPIGNLRNSALLSTPAVTGLQLHAENDTSIFPGSV